MKMIMTTSVTKHKARFLLKYRGRNFPHIRSWRCLFIVSYFFFFEGPPSWFLTLITGLQYEYCDLRSNFAAVVKQ